MKLNYLKSSLLIAFVAICIAFSTKHIYTGLPTSGQITMDMIRAELGVPSQANFSLDNARDGVYAPLNPYSPYLPPLSGQVKVSDWYGYCHTCTTLYSHTVYYSDAFSGGFASAADACSGTRSHPITVYSSSSTLTTSSTLFILSSNVYYPFIVDDTEQWVYSNTGTKPIQMNGSNTIAAVGGCSYTVNWSFDNAAGSIYTEFFIYKNGSVVLSRTFSDAGSLTYDPGDTIRIILSKSGTDGYTNEVIITGGYTFSSSNNSDTNIDTGTQTPTGGTVNVTASVNFFFFFMKKTKEASGWLKATLLFAAVMIAIASFAQKKPDALPVKDTVKAAPKADTLVIGSKVAFIKLEGDARVFPVDQLKKSVIILSGEDLDLLINQIQEYPAKFANPFTQWLARFFGIQFQPPGQPKQ